MSADSLLHFFYSQWFLTPKPPTTSFAGQTVIVTGSNTGLGREALRKIVSLGAERAILACRSPDKGEAAREDVEQSTGRKGVVEVWPLDLASYASVQAFAARARALPRLDVLLENAAVSTRRFALAEEDEATVTANVVSTFLLGFLLLPKLRETAVRCNTRPRLVVVSSEVHAHTRIPERTLPGRLLDNLSSEEHAAMGQRYMVSKLLEVLAVRAFVDEYASAPDYPVVVNLVNPGFCHSELMRELGWIQYVLKFLLHARSTEEGGRTLVIAAAAGQETHGKYMSNGRVEDIAKWVTTDEGRMTQERFWVELKEKLERIQPGIFADL